VWKGREEGAAILYSSGRQIGSESVGRNNAGADGHTAMHDEMLHCAAWESRNAITLLDQR
jgi:hypothetical protein